MDFKYNFEYKMFNTALIGLGDIGNNVCDEFLKWDNPWADGYFNLFSSFEEYRQASIKMNFDFCFIVSEIQAEADIDEFSNSVGGIDHKITLGVLLISPVIEKKVADKKQPFIEKLSKIPISHVLLSKKLLTKINGRNYSVMSFTNLECLTQYFIGSVFNFLCCPCLLNHNLGDLRGVIRFDDETHQNTYFLGFGRSKDLSQSIILAVKQLPSDYLNQAHRQYFAISICPGYGKFMDMPLYPMSFVNAYSEGLEYLTEKLKDNFLPNIVYDGNRDDFFTTIIF